MGSLIWCHRLQVCDFSSCKTCSPETAFLASAPAPTVNVARPRQEHLRQLCCYKQDTMPSPLSGMSCLELSSCDQECVTPFNNSIRGRLLAPVSKTIKKQIKAKGSFRQASVSNGLMDLGLMVNEIERLEPHYNLKPQR